jgi:hypothetical protein
VKPGKAVHDEKLARHLEQRVLEQKLWDAIHPYEGTGRDVVAVTGKEKLSEEE